MPEPEKNAPKSRGSRPVNRGLLRVGVLLSFLWLMCVGGVAVQEGHNRSEVCAITPEVGNCHRYFWSWQWSDAAKADAAAARNDFGAMIDGALKNPEMALKHVGTLMNKYGADKAAEYKLDSVFFAEMLLGPLIFLWGFGLGLAWCIAGFRADEAKG
jgi:hypothetical protein